MKIIIIIASITGGLIGTYLGNLWRLRRDRKTISFETKAAEFGKKFEKELLEKLNSTKYISGKKNVAPMPEHLNKVLIANKNLPINVLRYHLLEAAKNDSEKQDVYNGLEVGRILKVHSKLISSKVNSKTGKVTTNEALALVAGAVVCTVVGALTGGWGALVCALGYGYLVADAEEL